MCKRRDEGDPANYVSEQGGKEELVEVASPRQGVFYNQVKDRGGSCHNVVEASQPNDVRQDDDDAYPGRIRSRQQPNHQGDQPPSENCSD